MLRDEYLLMLAVVYSSFNKSTLNKVRTSTIEKLISDIQKDERPAMQQILKILPSESDKISDLLYYLEEKGYIKGQWLPGLPGDRGIYDGFLNITAKGIDCIEDPFDTLSKEYPRIATASNVMNINANRDVNIIESAIIQKNIQKFSDTELKELNNRLDELKDVISDASSKETLEEIRGDLESNEKINAAQKLSKFQNFVAKMRDAGTLIQVTLLTYKIISLIFHLPNIGL